MRSVTTEPQENVPDPEQQDVEFKSLFGEILGCEDCSSDEITDWLNCGAEHPGFHLLNDEIMADVRWLPAG